MRERFTNGPRGGRDWDEYDDRGREERGRRFGRGNDRSRDDDGRFRGGPPRNGSAGGIAGIS